MSKNIYLTIFIICSFFCSCVEKSVEKHAIRGSIDGEIAVDSAPQKVVEAINKCFVDRHESVVHDEENNLSVWSLVWCSSNVSSDGYGIVVSKDRVSTYLPNIYHGKNPIARFDAKKKILWLACGAIEGTGVCAERLYALKFDEKGNAQVAFAIDPYKMQEALRAKLFYSVDGNRISIYSDENHLYDVAVKENDMGGLDSECPVWIGEQLRYDISGDDIYVRVNLGVKFNTGLVLNYEELIEIVAEVDIDENGEFSINWLDGHLSPFEGEFYDVDNGEPCLHISYRRNDGLYDVNLSIIRLTHLNNGLAYMGDEGLVFQSKCDSGDSVSGLISLHSDTLMVTIKDSKWPLLENGSTFKYVSK